MSPEPDQEEPVIDNRHWRLYLSRTYRRRCPRCGDGALFLSTYRLAVACTACGLVYRREDGAMTGQMYLSAAVTEILAAVLIGVVFVFTDWGAWTSIAVCLPLVVGFCYWSLPKFMGLWVAIEYMTDIANREPWIRN